MAGRQRLQGRRRRPALQGPAGPGQEPRHHGASRARAGWSRADHRAGRRRPTTPAGNVVLATGSYAAHPARPGDRRRAGHHQRPRAAASTTCRARRSCSAAASSASSSPASGSRSAPRSRSSRRCRTWCRSRTRPAPSCSSGPSASAASPSSSAPGSPGSSTPRPACACRSRAARRFEADLLLVAVGRGPVSADLGYEEAGVAHGARLRPRRRVLPDVGARASTRSATSIPTPAAGARRLRARASSSPSTSPA